MRNPLKNKIINFILLILGGAGYIWTALQDDSIFIFFHPISIFSILFLLIWVIRVIIQIFRFGLRELKFDLGLLLVILVIIISLQLKDSEIFKSEKILEAKLSDDLSYIELILRENNHFETITHTVFGSSVVHGDYVMHGDTLVFQDKPYSNDLIPNQVFIDSDRQRIWLYSYTAGEFDTTEIFGEYFEISYNSLEF